MKSTGAQVIAGAFLFMTIVTQSKAKSLEDSHVDAHEILHCTSFRSG